MPELTDAEIIARLGLEGFQRKKIDQGDEFISITIPEITEEQRESILERFEALGGEVHFGAPLRIVDDDVADEEDFQAEHERVAEVGVVIAIGGDVRQIAENHGGFPPPSVWGQIGGVIDGVSEV
ncbi:MAG: hypothetical protein RLN62_04265 [Rickettsiales bacterium]